MLVADGERVLVTESGDLALWEENADRFVAVGRPEAFKGGEGLVFTHLRGRMHLCGDAEVGCVELEWPSLPGLDAPVNH
jgi:hypothetical protein